MFEIRNLSGQEYVDTYATKKAEALPSEVARVEPVVDVTNGHRRSSAEVLSRSGAATPGR
jgi:hypothetical protein